MIAQRDTLKNKGHTISQHLDSISYREIDKAERDT